MLASSALAFWVPSSTKAFAEESLRPQLNVLFIGNSMVRGVRRPLERMLEAYGLDSRVGSLAPGIWDLEQHARSGSTRQKLSSYPWHVVILQEQSNGIYEGIGYASARALDQEIKSIGAVTLFFMTWRDRGFPPAAYDVLHGVEDGTFGYIPIAYELRAPIAPVGWSVRNAIIDGFALDLWKGGRGRHLGLLGRYLAACVVFTTLTGQSPVGLYAPERFEPGVALYLQQLARKTVLSHLAEWNIGVH